MFSIPLPGLLANLALVWWYNHVPRYLGPYAEGNHRACTIVDEGQDHRTSGAQILCLDRWFYLGFFVNLPANVDIQARVRREWTIHCPPQVLLRWVWWRRGNYTTKGTAKLIPCSTSPLCQCVCCKRFQPSYEQAKRGSCYQRAAMWIRCRPGDDGDSFSLKFSVDASKRLGDALCAPPFLFY